MPTWTLTPINGNQTSLEIANYNADSTGAVINFAVTSNGATETFHIAPQAKAAEMPGILSAGLGALTNIAGSAGGFKMAQAAISKMDGEGGFQLGGAAASVTEMAGGILGAFLAHTAAQAATKMYANRPIESGDYYNSANQMVFHGPIKVDGSGNQIA
jgi:hypothetical protein